MPRAQPATPTGVELADVDTGIRLDIGAHSLRAGSLTVKSRGAA
jgi:hypothetical protein